MNDHLLIRINEDLKIAFKKRCIDDRTNMSKVLVELIEKYVESQVVKKYKETNNGR